jgi:DNA-binding GntR family transcriptional regulator
VESDGVEAALEFLRRAVVVGQFTPGEKLNQANIALNLGMSRIPVREALGILAAEGSLNYERNRGYTVPKMNVATLDQIYRMRALLEADLLRHSRRPSAVERANLTAINKSMQTAAEDGNLADFVRLNREFHFAVFDLADSPLVVQVVERLWRQSESYRAMYLYDSRNAERSAGEHEQLIEALTRLDIERCIEVSDQHRLSVLNHVRGVLAMQASMAGELAGSS